MAPSGKVEIPQGVWNFHGHICPFMSIGYRMGQVCPSDEAGLFAEQISPV